IPFISVLVSAICLPPRRQYCRRSVGGPWWAGSSILLPNAFAPKSKDREVRFDAPYGATQFSYGAPAKFGAAQSRLVPKKKDKSPAKPRKKTESRSSVGSCPSGFSVK